MTCAQPRATGIHRSPRTRVPAEVGGELSRARQGRRRSPTTTNMSDASRPSGRLDARDGQARVGPLSSASRRQPVSRRATGTPEASAPGGGGHWGACGSRSACRSCTAWWCKRRWRGQDGIVFSCPEGSDRPISPRICSGHVPVLCPAQVSGCLPRAFRSSSPPRSFIASFVLLGPCDERRAGLTDARFGARAVGELLGPTRHRVALTGEARRSPRTTNTSGRAGGCGWLTRRPRGRAPRRSLGLARRPTAPRRCAIAARLKRSSQLPTL